MNLKKSNIKNIILIKLIVVILISILSYYFYHENNKVIDCSDRDCINFEEKNIFIFQEEVEYIKNNINTIVSDFEKEAANGTWYAVDIKFIRKIQGDFQEDIKSNSFFSNALVIFEDGHHSYLVDFKKEENSYIVDGYYTFIQRPGEKVGWKNIKNDEKLEIGEVIHHWSIDQ